MAYATPVLREQSERLRFLASSGCTNAAKGLSEMTGRDIDIVNTLVDLVPFSAVPSIVGGAETEVVGVCLAFEGNLQGYIALLMPIRDAFDLVDMLIGAPAGTTRALDVLERSALAEAGNITGSYFLNAVADLTNLSLWPSPPIVLMDMAGSVLDGMLLDLAREGDKALVLETTFAEPARQISGHFFIFPRASSLTRLLSVG